MKRKNRYFTCACYTIWDFIEQNSITNIQKFLKEKKPKEYINKDKQNLLHFAAIKNSRKKVFELFGDYPELINGKDCLGKTPLHYCIEKDFQLGIIDFLISNEANIYVEDNLKRIPLFYLCMKESFDPKLLMRLARKSSDFELKDVFGTTPIHYICQYSKDLKIIQFFLKECVHLDSSQLKNNLNQTPLHFACHNTHKDIRFTLIGFLLDWGFKPQDIDSYQRSIAHYLCMNEPTLDLLDLIFEYNIDFNLTDKDGRTPLHHLTFSKSISSRVFDSIFEKTPEIDLQDNFGNTLLHYLCKNNQPVQIIKHLLEKSPNINLSNKKNKLVLHLALKYLKDLELIKFIMERTDNINQQDYKSRTPLTNLCRYQHSLEFVKLFLQSGADYHLIDHKNRPPLFYCLKTNPSFDTIELLVDSELANLMDAKLNNCLHFAFKYNAEMPVVKLLLKNGADINAFNKERDLPLNLAVKKPQYLTPRNLKLFASCNADFTRVSIYPYKRLVNQMQEYFDSLTNDFLNLLIREEFTDYVFYCLQGEIKVHKLILELRLLGQIDPERKNHPIIDKLQTVTQNKPKFEVIYFMNFLYTGFTDPSSQVAKMQSILPIMKQLNLPDRWFHERKNRTGFLNDLEKLYLDQPSKDFRIIVEGKPILCHKIILSARSGLFRGMFFTCDDPSNSVSEYTEKHYETMVQLIKFFYLDEIDDNCSNQTKTELMDTIDYYQLNDKTTLFLELDNID
ncbi:molting protein mlt-4 [Anaeramoeba ignava]|uniref:Molting protein mlt-4 n=1 Tax=Anaeramoeba ignava TaxID=1746090 RepID=A0A9Q0L7N5_ANAIG|nr:molting protein mlt-4 [Anaeramoeba ignava]